MSERLDTEYLKRLASKESLPWSTDVQVMARELLQHREQATKNARNADRYYAYVGKLEEKIQEHTGELAKARRTAEWLVAEARWQRDQARDAANEARYEASSLRGHARDEIQELVAEGTKQKRERLAVKSDNEVLRWLHAEAVWQRDEAIAESSHYYENARDNEDRRDRAVYDNLQLHERNLELEQMLRDESEQSTKYIQVLQLLHSEAVWQRDELAELKQKKRADGLEAERDEARKEWSSANQRFHEWRGKARDLEDELKLLREPFGTPAITRSRDDYYRVQFPGKETYDEYTGEREYIHDCVRRGVAAKALLDHLETDTPSLRDDLANLMIYVKLPQNGSMDKANERVLKAFDDGVFDQIGDQT